METELQSVTLMNYDFKNSHYNMTSKNLAKANWSTTTAGVFRAATSDWKPATRDGNALVLGSGCQFYFKTNYRLPLYESAYANYVPMTLNFTFQPKNTNSTIIELLTYDPFDKTTDLYSRKLSIGFRAGNNGTICGAYIFRYTASGKPDQIISEIPSTIDSSTPYPRNMGTVDDSYTLSLTHRGNKITVASIKNNITGQIHYFVPTSGVVVFEADYLALRVTANVARIYSLNDTPKKDVIVTFNSNGGSSVPSRTLKQGSMIGTLPTSAKVGYDLLGWYTTLSGGSRISSTTVVNSNSTYYAHWTSNTCTVTFNSNGDSYIAPITVKSGSKISASVPTKSGYRFIGWYVSDASSAYPFDFNTPITFNLTLYARWEAINYVVRFNSDGGSAVATQYVPYGQTATKPTDPTKSGYKFVNWCLADASEKTVFNFNSKIYWDTNLIATWTKVVDNITVTFNSADGSAVASQTISKGSKATKPADPTKSGYTFAGWYIMDGSSEVRYNFSNAVISNITLIAHWTYSPTTYTITYNSNGHGTTPATVYNATKLPNPLPSMSASGYNFAGWYTNSALTTAAVPGATINSNITLYAKWIAVKTYTVAFNSMGGSAVTAQSVVSGNKATKPTNPTKSGYTFVNWYISDGSSEIVYNFNSAVYNNITLIAHWTKDPTITYTVTFNSMGGTSVPSQKVEKGNLVTKPTNPTRTNYTFNGWYIMDGSEQVPYNFNSAVYDNLTLYANWTYSPTTYTVTFNSNGGSTVSPKTVTSGSKVTKPSNPYRSYYDFVGWYYSPDSSSYVEYNFNNSVYSNITLTAEWKLREYTITFNSMGGSEVPTQKVAAGYRAIRPSDPTKAGYLFKQWCYYDSSEEIPFDFDTTVYYNLSLMATWTPASSTNYTVKFYDRGVIIQSITLPKGSIIPSGSIPSRSRSGYTFKGWYLNGTKADLTKPLTSDMNLEAEWQANGNITLALDSHGQTDVWSKVSGLDINSGSLVVHADGYDWFYDGQYITVPDGSTIQLKYSGYSNRIAVVNPSGSTVAVLSADSDGLKNITVNGTSSGSVTCNGDTFIDANYI